MSEPNLPARATRAKHAKGRRKFGAEHRDAYLEAIEAGATQAEAARQVGFSTSTIKRYMAAHADFRELVDRALDVGVRHRDLTTVLTAEVRAQLVDLVGRGRSLRAACAEVQPPVSYGNARRYREGHEQWANELADAKVLAVDRLVSAAWDGATGKLPNVNARLIEYLLNNKRPREFRTARLIGVGFAGEGAPVPAPDTSVVDVDVRDARTKRLGDLVLGHGRDAAALAAVIDRAMPADEAAG